MDCKNILNNQVLNIQIKWHRRDCVKLSMLYNNIY